MSIEALNWSRRQRVGDALAKAVLRHVCDYADEDGRCWPSLRRIADEVEVSIDTGRRKLAVLETGGYIVRLATWLDDNGLRNHDRRGRQTADEIRIVLSREPNVATVEQNSPNDDPENDSPIEPPPLAGTGGVASQPGGAGTGGIASDTRGGVAVVPPPNEPSLNQDSPQPPFGGSVDVLEGWKEFERDWNEPILRQSLAQQVWSALTPDEREIARKAARGYVLWRKGQKKPPNVLGAHLFLKERDAWPEFASRAPSEASSLPPATVFAAENSLEWRALAVIAAIDGRKPPSATPHPEGRGVRVPPLSLAEMALAQFADDKPEGWMLVRAGTPQCGAWKQFLSTEARPITVGFKRQEITPGRFVDDWPIKEMGLRAPCEWPPRKDGTLLSTGPPESLCTDEDLRDFAQSKIG